MDRHWTHCCVVGAAGRYWDRFGGGDIGITVACRSGMAAYSTNGHKDCFYPTRCMPVGSIYRHLFHPLKCYWLSSASLWPLIQQQNIIYSDLCYAMTYMLFKNFITLFPCKGGAWGNACVKDVRGPSGESPFSLALCGPGDWASGLATAHLPARPPASPAYMVLELTSLHKIITYGKIGSGTNFKTLCIKRLRIT